MPTEEEIRRWVRDERDQIRQEEQSSCRHLSFGTLREDGSVSCMECGKVLSLGDADKNAGATYERCLPDADASLLLS